MYNNTYYVSLSLSLWCYSTKVNEAGVAREDVETSVYYVKDALDANITYEAGPQVHTVREKKKDGYDDDVDMPDIGGIYLLEHNTKSISTHTIKTFILLNHMSGHCSSITYIHILGYLPKQSAF